MPQPDHTPIDTLNRAAPEEARALMERVIERSPWLAGRIVEARPFSDTASLAKHIAATITGLPREEAITLLCAHPELAPAEPEAMTSASRQEQGRLALAAPEGDIATRLADLNAAYRSRHGFPFVIALHGHQDMASVIAQFESRIAEETPRELRRGLGEVASVAASRLVRVFGPADTSPEPPRSSARLAQPGKGLQ
ncbi:MAG: 2-oxo-4-hydroxy-4-carboxy-5-ureidoimidazoline decarboxylase [Vannielia sp.]|uniref:2-oxo-4-hydroxy-4-carboxy-5-ureidoimidazoline decarboxylase n=1 Tax=Vannielia sp. TaxID=2813045 RepID=UPI003B8CFC00